MLVELNKEDLTSLVKSSVPGYSIFDIELVKQTGSYMGGFHDKWTWNSSELNKLTENQLWTLYLICRESCK